MKKRRNHFHLHYIHIFFITHTHITFDVLIFFYYSLDFIFLFIHLVCVCVCIFGTIFLLLLLIMKWTNYFDQLWNCHWKEFFIEWMNDQLTVFVCGFWMSFFSFFLTNGSDDYDDDDGHIIHTFLNYTLYGSLYTHWIGTMSIGHSFNS